MMPLQGRLSVEKMCWLGGVSRATFYRRLRRCAPSEVDMEIRHHIQKISLAHRRYGYRRVCAALRASGLVVNHKKVLRLMRLDNLLAVRKRQFVVTTESGHNCPVFPNYAQHIKPSRPNELWVADITYIRLRCEFVYLAVVLDAFSRAVVGWALGRSLQASVAVKALESAVAQRRPAPGLVHHSDRGVQYASDEYVAVLEQHEILGSMSRAGNPWDNAYCESFMKTLKQEEIYCSRYTGIADLEAQLAEFLDQYYNRERLHSALSYCTPLSYEQQHAEKEAKAAVAVANQR